MHVAILGTGAVGGYFGAQLARAGTRVTFVARGAHLQAIRDNGLQVLGPRGDFTIRAPDATDDPAAIAGADAVLFCVKTYDSDAAAAALAPALGPRSVVITLQNGIDSVERLSRTLPRDRVVAGSAYMAGKIEAPGIIRYTSAMSSIAVGRGGPQAEPVMRELADAAARAGFGMTVDPDVETLLWKKFAILAPNATLTSLTRKPAGVVFHDPDLLALATDAVREVVAVGRALAIAWPADIVETSIATLRGFPPDMYASMHHDLARGGPLEVEEVQGTLMRLGARHGVPTPIFRMAYCCLKPYVRGARG